MRAPSTSTIWEKGPEQRSLTFTVSYLWGRIGWTLVLYYLGSLAYYLYVRIKGMNLGLYNIYR